MRQLPQKLRIRFNLDGSDSSQEFPSVAPSPALCSGWARCGSGQRYDLTANGPKKCRHLAGDRGDDDRCFLADSDKPSVPCAESNLGLPSDVTDGFWQPLKAGAQGLADARRVAVSPRSFDEYATGTPVAGKRQAGPAHGLTC